MTLKSHLIFTSTSVNYLKLWLIDTNVRRYENELPKQAPDWVVVVVVVVVGGESLPAPDFVPGRTVHQYSGLTVSKPHPSSTQMFLQPLVFDLLKVGDILRGGEAITPTTKNSPAQTDGDRTGTTAFDKK